MGLLRKSQQILPRLSFISICKNFMRSWVHYADIVHDEGYNSAFHDKLKSIQYNAYLAITGAIRGISTEKLYQDLGLESLKSRRCFKKLRHFIRYSMKNPPGI